MLTDNIGDWIFGYNQEAVLATGFDDAILGVVEGSNSKPVAVYDRETCIQILIDDFKYMQDKQEEEFDQELYIDAVEFFEDTILPLYDGKNAPLFLTQHPCAETLQLF